jgi:predicted O-linked N-acetylglucosamine transferase (SPINDLY family)
MLKDLVQALLRRAGDSDAAPAGREPAAAADRLHLCIVQAAGHAAAGDHAAAADLYRESLELQPQDPKLWCNLGAELDAIGEADESEFAYRRALELDPALAETWYNLGRLLQEKGRATESASCYGAAAALVDGATNRPLWLLIYNNWGLLLYKQGQPQEAVTLYRKALLEHAQAADLVSNLLLTMHYAEGYTQAELFAEHLAYAQRFEAPLKDNWLAHPNSRESGKRLKIGYVSPDFRDHAVAFFIEPVLAHHDHQQIEVYCYCSHSVSDKVTLRLKSLVEHWRDIRAINDDEAARRITEDGIDILVDLAGHTAGGRLQIFARKPAPVQVTWLGYPCTTGLSAMDYRISDAHADPIGMSESYCSETLYRLPDAFDCYKPPSDAPEVGALPAIAQGGITFGSFNNLAKVSPAVRKLWARVLLAVPGSRLLLKTVSLADAATRQRLIGDFAEHGVGEGRLILASADAAYSAHLNRYNQVDIGLDPFPYNGTTTSFEAMWMGVPVVTLAGNSFVSRTGVSMLTCLGMTDLIADTAEDYVAIAARLAGDLGRLAALRAGLRERMARSPLTDAKRFTLNLEKAYREMWERWCGGSQDEAR